jgi:hypothetical protein
LKAFLLYRNRDFDLERAPPPNESDLCRDLALDTLFQAIAAKDELVFEVARKAILAATSNDVATIQYRQDALKDYLCNPEVVRQLYNLTGETFLRLRKLWPRYRKKPSGMLDDAVSRMEIFIEMLKQIRSLADRRARLIPLTQDDL